MAIPKFVKKIRSALDNEFKRNLYRNLVFKGGGVRGIAYMGALEALDEYHLIENTQRVAGTSAGAIAATLVSFGLSIPETKNLFDSLDFTKVPQMESKSQGRKLLHLPEERSSLRFLREYGWYSSEYFYQWLQGIIADQTGGNPRTTFSEFQQLGFRELYIVAANVSRQRAELFSARQTPHVAVADAVRMSMSIPIFFEALQFDGKKFGAGDYYVDGGLYDNFPTHIFDKPSFAERSWAYRDGVNWETLGLFLYPDTVLHPADPENPKNVWEFITLLLRNMYHAHEISSYNTSSVNHHRSIEISDCGISATDFDIKINSKKYRLLYESGKQAVEKFFSPDWA